MTMVVPYFGYSTMERAVHPGEVVTAKTRARLLSIIPPASSGNRIFLLDLHSEGITHYFHSGMPARHLRATSVLLPAIRSAGGEDFVLGSTDAGRAKWVEGLANELGVEAAFVFKRRLSGSKTQVTALNASVENRTVVLYDDMIRTGGSLIGAAQAYRDAGATRLVAVCTHGVFCGDAYQRIRNTGLFDLIISTDSHPNANELVADGLLVVPVGEIFVEHLKH
jgi:ribose-phosphate pyrophosphokinase